MDSKVFNFFSNRVKKATIMDILYFQPDDLRNNAFRLIKQRKIASTIIQFDKYSIIPKNELFKINVGKITNTLCFSPDNSLFAYGIKKSVMVHKINYNVPDSFKKVELTFTEHKDEVSCVEFDPYSIYLASCSWDNTVVFYGVSKNNKDQYGKVLVKLKHHSKPVMALSFCQFGNLFASSGEDETVMVYELKVDSKKVLKLDQVMVLKEHRFSVVAMLFSPCGNFCAVGGYGDSVLVYGVNKYSDKTYGKPLINLMGHLLLGGVSSLAFSECSNFLAVGCWDKVLHIYGVNYKVTKDYGRKLLSLPQTGVVFSVDFSPLGTSLALAVVEKIKIINVDYYEQNENNYGRDIIEFAKHKSEIYSIKFSPCGKYLASCSKDKSIILYGV